MRPRASTRRAERGRKCRSTEAPGLIGHQRPRRNRQAVESPGRCNSRHGSGPASFNRSGSASLPERAAARRQRWCSIIPPAPALVSGTASPVRRRRHAELSADPPRCRHLDIAVTRHRHPLTRIRVRPQLVLRGLSDETTPVSGQMPLELPFLHAATSTDSTSAQPFGGMLSPRARRSSSTKPIASRTISRASSRLPPWVWTSGSSGTCA